MVELHARIGGADFYQSDAATELAKSNQYKQLTELVWYDAAHSLH